MDTDEEEREGRDTESPSSSQSRAPIRRRRIDDDLGKGCDDRVEDGSETFSQRIVELRTAGTNSDEPTPGPSGTLYFI